MPYADPIKNAECKRQWYLDHKEELNARGRENYQRNKEHISVQQHQYYLNNKERISEYWKERYRKIGKKWYEANKSKCYARSQQNKRQLKQWFQSLKVGKFCKKCGEDDWRCLDYHHTNPTTKDAGLGDMISWGLSKKRILAEIGKCAIICSNCHRKSQRQG